MPELSHKRCFNHQMREAAARCPECGRFFCRECVTEHEDRVLCAACLGKFSKTGTRLFQLNGMARIFQFMVGGIVIWLIFIYLGHLLISIPDSFHDGTLWQNKFGNNVESETK